MAFRMNFKILPRCSAKARSNSGNPCRQAAMKNGRCHWHGGASPIKHGGYSTVTVLLKKEIDVVVMQARQELSLLGALVDKM